MRKILIAGKGGVGKSFLTYLLGEFLRREKGKRVIIFDTDESNQSLYRYFGFKEPPLSLLELLGGKGMVKKKLREALKRETPEPEINLFENPVIRLEDIPEGYVLKAEGLRYLTVGKIKEPLEGCACPMGVLAREFLKRLELGEEEVLLVDTEAGVEHFGRGLEREVDQIIALAEPYLDALEVAKKIMEFGEKLGKRVIPALNKVMLLSDNPSYTERIKELDFAIVIPFKAEAYYASLSGERFAPETFSEALSALVERLNL